MKTKQIIVFDKIAKLHYPYIEGWYYPFSDTPSYKMTAHSVSAEEYHLIANATNKFWDLIKV